MTSAGGAASAGNGSSRLEHIQSLRALAVLGVVAFHFWPSALPGGFIGVDIFFVISGLLITGGIIRQVERGSFSFGGFYLRRLRRLIPAAATVALISGVVAWLVLPVSRWLDTFSELLAASVYVENWLLVLRGDDYFQGTPSLAQHYWSLSVEEQFYLVWPLLIVVSAGIGRRTGSVRRGITVGLLALTVASFVASVIITPAAWQTAYFATHTRAWEFGVGALLALSSQVTRELRHGVVGWLGLVVLLICLYVYQGTWPFPGWIAAIPVLATAACLWGGFGSGHRWPSRLVLSRPVQWVGDISYSLYLWHWPVVILAPWIVGAEPSWTTEVGLLALCLILAWITKAQVEDRFRQGGAAAARHDPGRRRALAASVALPVVVVAGCGAVLVWIDADADQARSLEQTALSQDLDCYGADEVQRPGCSPPFGEELVPTLATAHAGFTRSSANEQCMQLVTRDEVIRCEFGEPSSSTTVALVGDSHGLAWLPAARRAAEERGWRLVTYLRGACPVNAAVTERYVPGEQELCRDWSNAVIDEVAADPQIDLVMTAALNTVTWIPAGDQSSFETAVDGYVDAWSTWVSQGLPVVVMEETPLPRPQVLECLSVQPAAACAQPESEASQPGPSPLHAAAEQMQGQGEPVYLQRVRDLFCVSGVCPAVAGNVVVYVDSDHVSRPYMRTLSDRVGRGWDEALTLPGGVSD